ncbi:uncharacterized protein LOC118191705 isoform X2 [Stegodyphus dumicola]|nr:uncharacterized protein LOC118191705 isoform X2 [Stegodyphus dumicola]XP_035218431.1 uncharacterized protein LOC118191705 isoform X2 [Stegodyphus dumicola]
MANPESKEESLLLLPWLIDHLERETFEGLRWSDKDSKIFYVYWMHKAADPWTRKQVEVCEAWAKYKGNKKENPRDIKANFRCALRSKKELKLVQKTKDRLFWKIIDTGTEADKNNSKRSVPTSSSSSSSSDEGDAGIATFGSNEVCRSSKKRKYTKAPVSRPKQSRRGRKKSIEKDITLSFSEIRTHHDSSASSSQMSSSMPVSNEKVDHRLTPFQAIPLIPEIQSMSPFCAKLPSADIQPASPITDVQRMSPAQVTPSIADRTSPFQTIPSAHELQEMSCVELQSSPFLDEQRIMSPRISPLPNSDIQTMMDFQSPPSLCSTINLEQLSTITSSSYLLGEQRLGKPLPSFTTFNHQNRLTPPKQSKDISAYGEDLTLQEERCSWKSTTDASQFYQNAKQQDRRLPFIYMSNSPSANEEQLVPSTSPMNLNLYFDNNNFHSPAKNFQENMLYSPLYEPSFELLSDSPMPSQDSQYVENSDAILEEFYNFSSLFTEYVDS